jgi:hypothetical protein
MAKASDIKIKVDDFFIETRISNCAFESCLNRNHYGACNLKKTSIDEHGICTGYIDYKTMQKQSSN